MSAIDIHPEDLFDRLAAGTLTEAEAEHLRAHLATCGVCRFELSTRSDFRAELAALPNDLSAPPLLPLDRASIAPDAPPLPEPYRPAVARAGRPRVRRGLVWFFAAAGLFIATGALASAVSGTPPWRLLGSLVAAPAPAAAPGSQAPQQARHVAGARAKPAVLPSAQAKAPEAGVSSNSPVIDVQALRPSSARAPSGAPPSTSSAGRSAEASPAVAVTLSAPELFAAANRARSNGQTARAVSLYRQLQTKYPRSAEAELSELTLATLLLHIGDARAALAGFDRYLARGTRSLQAEALVGRALAQRALGQRESEIAAWTSVASRFPGTSYARRAEERLGALGRR